MLNRIWNVALVCAMLIWLAIMVDRLGALYVFGFIALAFALRRFHV